MSTPTEHPAIQSKRYLEPEELDAHLEGVEYIVMAAPAPENFKDTPIHFTIFLNTQEALPADIVDAVFDKFCDELGITKTAERFAQLDRVAFSEAGQDTPMPMHLFKPEQTQGIPYTIMYVFDFLGDSDGFSQAKDQALTGWSYSYERD